MSVIDVQWTPHVNVLMIECDCGYCFVHLTCYSAAKCQRCGRMELWHSVEPRPIEGIWSLPVMELWV